MSFLKKLFGAKDPFDEIPRLLGQKDWAGALVVARRAERDGLAPDQLEALDGWETEAGDALAELNLEEGHWAQQDGKLTRAREHYQLAVEQARSAAVRERAKRTLAAFDRGESVTSVPAEASAASCGSQCGPSCGPLPTAPEDELADLDAEGRLELLLATLPNDLAERYSAAGPRFLEAWLATQDGEDARALELLDSVPAAERGSLFLCERGLVRARTGDLKAAADDLGRAMQDEPELFPAFDGLLSVLLTAGREREAEGLLRETLAAKRFEGACWVRLAELHARRGEIEPALAAGLKAIELGQADPNLKVLCAQLLERSERFDEAEKLLAQLPAGGGCGGASAHPLLAEFWLRRSKNPDKALEAFKGALRHEPGNPLWLLRIAQAYLLKGWTKEAAAQLDRLMGAELDEALMAEVRATAEQMRQT